jgi:hypothetical protein
MLIVDLSVSLLDTTAAAGSLLGSGATGQQVAPPASGKRDGDGGESGSESLLFALKLNRVSVLIVYMLISLLGTDPTTGLLALLGGAPAAPAAPPAAAPPAAAPPVPPSGKRDGDGGATGS